MENVARRYKIHPRDVKTLKVDARRSLPFFQGLAVALLIFFTVLIPFFSPRRSSCCQNETCRGENDTVSIPDITNLLNSVENFQKTFGGKNMFFTETSGKGILKPRQACTIESFARLNPTVNLILIFTGPVATLTLYENRALAEIIANHQNVHLTTVDPKLVFDGTGLEEAYLKAIKGPHPFVHLSDLLRLALLWKVGGAYMDLDLISVKSMTQFLEKTKNFLTPMDDSYLNTCLLGFTKNHPLLGLIIKIIGKNFDAQDYIIGLHSFNTAITNVTGKLPPEVVREGKLLDVVIPSYKMTSPVRSMNHYTLIMDNFGSNYKKWISESIVVHFWNHMTNDKVVTLDSKCALAKIARIYCPRSFWSCNAVFY